MNKVEVLKAEKDGLDIKESIARYAELGWEAISEEDIQRLKWYGVFLRNPTPGFFMVRVRIPGGRTTTEQIHTLAHLAKTYGNGLLDLTTRQQFQLRQLRIAQCSRSVVIKLEEAGLTSLQTGMDNVRNIMTCPVAGLTAREQFDATDMVARLTQEFTGNRTYSNLPRKFNMAITGCLDNCLHLETQDLALVPATMAGTRWFDHGVQHSRRGEVGVRGLSDCDAPGRVCPSHGGCGGDRSHRSGVS